MIFPSMRTKSISKGNHLHATLGTNPYRHRPLSLLRKARIAASLAALACVPFAANAAGTGNLIYQGMTLPSGLVKIGADYWVSDHTFGFCKLVFGASGQPPGFVDQNFCSTAQVSPGQAVVKQVVDPVTLAPTVAYAYVPDNSSKGRGVWRHTIKDGYILNSIMLPNSGIDGNRPMAVAMGPDDHLYVSLGRNNSIMRIKNPSPEFDGLTDQKTEKIGSSAVKVGPPALAFLGNALYLAENTGLTALTAPGAVPGTSSTACTGTCTAQPVNAGVGAPVYVTADGTGLYIADLGNAYRYTPPASGIPGCLKLLGSGYGNIAGMAVNPATESLPASLYVADDPTAGTSFFKGVVYDVVSTSSSPCITTGGVAPGAPGGGTGTGAPPSATSPVTIGSPATGATLPGALVQIGSETWISDHLQGFCRLGTNGPEACVTNAALAPGQAVAVPSSTTPNLTYVYVPDTASKGLGVWRLTHDGTRISNATLLAPGKLSGARTSAVAYGPDNNLYVVSGKNNSVMRIANPTGNPVDVELIGSVTGRAGPPSMTFSGADLYFAEATGITSIPRAANCTKSAQCGARAVATPVGAPVFVTSDGTYLYIADISKAYRFTFPSATAPSSTTELGKGFATISALGFNVLLQADGITKTRSLYVGDDTTAGNTPGTGRVWKLDMTGLQW